MGQHYRESILLCLRDVEKNPETTSVKKRKRSPLAARLSNTMNALPMRAPSPSKKRKIQQANEGDGNVETTPRSLRSIQFEQNDTSQPSSASTRSSRSPTKHLTQMIFAPQPILLEQFLPRFPGKLPAELTTMLQDIEQRFSRGIAVISDIHEVW